MNTTMRHAAAALCGLTMICAGMARAETFTWADASGASWHTASSWDRGDVPGTDDNVVIGSGSVLLTNATAALASFTMNGGTLTFSNWTTRLSAGEIALQGGTVTHAICDTDVSASNIHRVYLVCSNLLLGAGATIDGYERGYRGGYSSTIPGQGPGGALNGGGGGTVVAVRSLPAMPRVQPAHVTATQPHPTCRAAAVAAVSPSCMIPLNKPCKTRSPSRA